MRLASVSAALLAPVLVAHAAIQPAGYSVIIPAEPLYAVRRAWRAPT